MIGEQTYENFEEYMAQENDEIEYYRKKVQMCPLELGKDVIVQKVHRKIKSKDVKDKEAASKDAKKPNTGVSKNKVEPVNETVTPGNTNNTIMEKKPESKTPQEEVINTNKAPQNEMLLTTTVKVQGNK